MQAVDDSLSERRPRCILVAITGTVDGQRALEYAIQLATLIEAELVGLVVEGRLPAYGATVGEVDEERSRQRPFYDAVSRIAVDQAAEHGLDMTICRRHRPIVRALTREATALAADLVVVGRPHGSRSIVHLPQYASLARQLRCPLLSVP